jgi:hypothetical protein
MAAMMRTISNTNSKSFMIVLLDPRCENAEQSKVGAVAAHKHDRNGG